MFNDDVLFDKNKREPSDDDLRQIESEGIDDSLFTDEIDSSVTLTDKELDMINEMVRIIEDPTYISEARKKRIEKENNEEEVVEKDYGLSFDNLSMGSYNDFDEDY